MSDKKNNYNKKTVRNEEMKNRLISCAIRFGPRYRLDGCNHPQYSRRLSEEATRTFLCIIPRTMTQNLLDMLTQSSSIA